MAMTEEERQKRLDELKAERTKRMEEAAKARAAADPMKDPTNRPEASQDKPGYVQYYSWIGGASTGQWKKYEISKDDPRYSDAYQARSTAGPTQATFTSAVGANTVPKPISTIPSTSGATVEGDGTNTGFATKDGILYYNGKPFSGKTSDGKTYTNGILDEGTGSTGFKGSTGATGTTTGLTQADLDAAVAKAVAEATAKTNAAMAQMKAEQEAAILGAKQKASDRLSSMFAAYGLESLAPFISARIMADVSEEMLLLELYDRPEYQQRFPGMKDLRAKKRTITEGEYMKIEKEMTQTARFFDLPVGFYDNPQDFGKLIANEVSAKEYQDRLQVGQDLARSLNPVVKQQLLGFYGVGEGGLTAYVLDPEKALSLIKKQAQAARFVGFGRGAGFQLQGITAGQAENIAGTEAYAKLSEQQLAQALGQAGQLRATQSRLAKIEGQAYNEEEALKAVIEGSPEALLASQQRAQREAARFGGRSGLTGQSLGSATAI